MRYHTVTKLFTAIIATICGLIPAIALADAAADADWEARASHPDVVLANRFDVQSDWLDNIYETSGCSPSYAPGCRSNAWDSSVAASGAGSARFDIKSNSGPSNAGSVVMDFSDNQFGANEEFWVQWRQRFDEYLITHKYQYTSGDGAWKQVILSQGNINSVVAAACTETELVVQNIGGRGYPSSYIECASYDLFADFLGYIDGNGTYTAQNQRNDDNGTNRCIYYPDGFDTSGCLYYEPDQWMTFMMHVQMGPEGEAVSSAGNNVRKGFVDSTYEFYAALEGQPLELVHRQQGLVIPRGRYWNPAVGTNPDAVGDPGYSGSWGPVDAHPDAKYGRFWLTPYITSKDTSETHDNASTWYDEVIVSRTRIADPGAALSQDPLPIVSLDSDVSEADFGSTAVLSWSASHADSCLATGSWRGDVDVAGELIVGPLEATSTFWLNCSNSRSTRSASVTIVVGDPPLHDPVSVTLSATSDAVEAGESVTLSWTSEGAETCTASGGWQGSTALSGSQVAGPLDSDTQFVLTCTGAGGIASAIANVSVASTEPYAVNLEADFRNLPFNSLVVLSWNAVGAQTCTASADWQGVFEPSGSMTVGPVVAGGNYALECTGPQGSSADSLAINLQDIDQDGLIDLWELQIFGNLANDGSGDSDNDGLSDLEEAFLGTDVFSQDTDRDGAGDAEEASYGSDPLDATDIWTDNRPRRPDLQDLSDATSPWGATFSPSVNYFDPNGDSLHESEWQIAVDDAFSDTLFHRFVRQSDTVTLPAGILGLSSLYHVRVRYWDSNGTPSEWSLPAEFTTTDSFPNDLDGNGIDDSAQVDQSVDTNGNGVDDSAEGICNLFDANANTVVGLQTGQGVIQCHRSVGDAELPPGEVDGDLTHGMFSFTVAGLPVDPDQPAVVDITIYFSDSLDDISGWAKYDKAVGATTDFTQFVTISGNTVVLQLTDGGIGDQDGVVNGIIVDPSGPVFNATPTPAPTPAPAPAPSDDSSGGGGANAPLGLLALLGVYLHRRRRVMH